MSAQAELAQDYFRLRSLDGQAIIGEPWDAAGIYYPVALLVLGVVAGLLSPQHVWAHYLDVLIGQLGYEVCARVGGGPAGASLYQGSVLT